MLADFVLFIQNNFVILDESWTDRWIQSKHKSDYGKFELSSGKFFGDKERDQGLKTSQVCFKLCSVNMVIFRMLASIVFLPNSQRSLATKERRW